MATEKGAANVESSGTDNDSIKGSSIPASPNSEGFPTPRFGKALAHRALYGSGSRQGGGRKARANDARALPSRLSKVSLADDTEK
ncbi:hypothetical protein Tsubulata_004231 [Turnera subulata]|uniref:Uncharacterized protein n=1 Tax=Turnera subulata TaxID=218843 RepID=A0A9Q0FVJ4_9ROSI|nr:hypothetical protein Tsubulata_004231 [Turnera subulata]